MAEFIKFEIENIIEDMKKYRDRKEGAVKGIDSNCHLEFSSRYGEVVLAIVEGTITLCHITISTDDLIQVDCGTGYCATIESSEELEQYLLKYCFNGMVVCEAINKFHLLEYFG